MNIYHVYNIQYTGTKEMSTHLMDFLQKSYKSSGDSWIYTIILPDYGADLKKPLTEWFTVSGFIRNSFSGN